MLSYLAIYKEKKSHGLESEIKHVIFSPCFKNKKLIVTNISVIPYSYATHRNTIMQRT